MSAVIHKKSTYLRDVFCLEKTKRGQKRATNLIEFARAFNKYT